MCVSLPFRTPVKKFSEHPFIFRWSFRTSVFFWFRTSDTVIIKWWLFDENRCSERTSTSHVRNEKQRRNVKMPPTPLHSYLFMLILSVFIQSWDLSTCFLVFCLFVICMLESKKNSVMDGYDQSRHIINIKMRSEGGLESDNRRNNYVWSIHS